MVSSGQMLEPEAGPVGAERVKCYVVCGWVIGLVCGWFDVDERRFARKRSAEDGMVELGGETLGLYSG